MLILGIETTCDETAAAVVRDGREVVSSVVGTQIDLHRKYGGVVPEIASRAHLEELHLIVAEAMERAGVKGADLDGVAVSHAPGLIGCLLIGVSAAKGLAFGWSKPLIGVNHVQAHLYSVMLEDEGRREGENARREPIGQGPPPPVSTQDHGTPAGHRRDADGTGPLFPAVGLVISGGHSSLYHVKAFDDLRRIGSTHDDAVGEAFDKVAAILQLGYPGGPLIDELAKRGNADAVKFPLALMEPDSLDFSFSGIKTSVLYHVNGKKGRERDASAMSEQGRADVAASFQKAAAAMLTEKIRRAAYWFDTKSIIVGGGVSANSAIRAAVQGLGVELGLPVFIPPMKYCTDNAAMVAGLGYRLLVAGKVAGLDLDAVATV